MLSDACVMLKVYLSEKLPLSQKLHYLRGELFFTMFYTGINSSPLLVTKKVFMLTIILSNYQQYPVPLRAAQHHTFLHVHINKVSNLTPLDPSHTSHTTEGTCYQRDLGNNYWTQSPVIKLLTILTVTNKFKVWGIEFN